MSDSRSIIQQTISVLRERGIPATPEEIKPIFEDPQTGTAAIKWAEEHLTQTTLLSKEEAILYAKLEGNGVAKAIEARHDLSTVTPILDGDIRSAIASLKASTTAIDKQTETLKLQWKHLEALSRQKRDGEARRAKEDAASERRHLLERQHLVVATDEMFQDLKRKLEEAIVATENVGRDVKAQVQEGLTDDNRVLKRLEDLGDNSTLDEFDGKGLLLRTDKLTAKLVEYMTGEVEHRLDRIYLETLHSDSNREGPGDGDSEQESTLKEELDSLYSEIEVVAEMAVQQEFKTPISNAVVHKERLLAGDTDAKLDSISRYIDCLVDRAEQTRVNIERFADHRRAIHIMNMSFEKELAKSSLQSKSPTKQFPRSSSPSKRTASSTKDTALQALLRNLGVSLPENTRDVNASNDDISKAIEERKDRLVHIVRRLESTMDGSLLAPLSTSGDAIQDLSGVLYADSKSARPDLKDRSLDALMDSLDARVAALAKELEVVDIDVVNERDRALERFIHKWTEADS